MKGATSDCHTKFVCIANFLAAELIHYKPI